MPEERPPPGEQRVLFDARHFRDREARPARRMRMYAHGFLDRPAVLDAVPSTGAPVGDLGAGIRDLERFAADVGDGRIGPIERDGQSVYVGLEAPDRERYTLEMKFTHYLVKPPQCAFVNDRRANVERAWPYPAIATPFRSPEFICTPPTFEYHLYHSEPRYRYGDGTLVAVVSVVYWALHAPGYRGRFGGPLRARR